MATTKKTSSPQPLVPLHRESGYRLFKGDGTELNPFSLQPIAEDPLTDDQELALLEMAEPGEQPAIAPIPEPEPTPVWQEEIA